MNCDECKERVFELIEQEATDPKKVREVLQACPECRALFEELKAGLAVAAKLPMEDPPPRLDAAILDAAARGHRRVPPAAPRRWWAHAPQWAMAAVALLAIGIGVWVVPRGVRLEEKETPSSSAPLARFEKANEVSPKGARRSAAVTSAEEDDESGAAPSDRVSVERVQAAEPPARRGLGAGRGAVATAPSAEKEPSAQKYKKSRLPTAAEAAQGAETRQRVAPAVTFGSDQGRAADAAADRSELEERARSRKLCERLIRQYELSKKEDAELELDSEQQLKLGRCYAEVGRVDPARALLERAASDLKTKDRAEVELRLLEVKTDPR